MWPFNNDYVLKYKSDQQSSFKRYIWNVYSCCWSNLKVRFVKDLVVQMVCISVEHRWEVDHYFKLSNVPLRDLASDLIWNTYGRNLLPHVLHSRIDARNPTSKSPHKPQYLQSLFDKGWGWRNMSHVCFHSITRIISLIYGECLYIFHLEWGRQYELVCVRLVSLLLCLRFLSADV